MSNLQLVWSEAELLATDDVDEPLIAAGVRCHGGYTQQWVRVAAHEIPGAGDRGVAAVAPRAVRDRDPRIAARVVARRVPERRAVEVPAARRRARADDLVAHAHRHGRGLRVDDPSGRSRRHPTALRREHRGNRCRAPAERAVRGARARRSRLRGRGRPQADVVRGARHRVREPGHRRHDRGDARTHGDRAPGREAAVARANARQRRSAAPLPGHRPAARDDASAHDQPPVHRGLGVPHVRVGRSSAVRRRPRAGRGRARRARAVHPRRRDAARRLPAHRAHRDARPHVRR